MKKIKEKLFLRVIWNKIILKLYVIEVSKFLADSLPKDDGEFYQFVYISQCRHIRGASIPFQFKRKHMTDYVEIDDQEAVIIK